LFLSSAVLLALLSAAGYVWLREDKSRGKALAAASNG
jgi:hypothetical protein